jgi:hypothetical protein
VRAAPHPPPLSHREARSLFFARAEEELGAEDQRRLAQHLEGCGDCQAGWQRYSATVLSLRRVERERAPPSLSTVVLTRVRRRRREPRAVHHVYMAHRVPIEAAVPLLLGVAVAAFLVLAAW